MPITIQQWKKHIQERLADAFGLKVMVCHYPTRASKWNLIEYRFPVEAGGRLLLMQQYQER